MIPGFIPLCDFHNFSFYTRDNQRQPETKRQTDGCDKSIAAIAD